MNGPADAAILAELVAIARQQTPDLAQFSSLASAHQYLGLYQLWRRHVPAGAHALDWGAGGGHFSYFLLRAGYRATGFSLWPVSFEHWLPPGHYQFVAGSIDEPARLPFADQAFDAVASVGVLEHVRETAGDEAASLAEIARVLKPGGTFLCWHLPNRGSWIEFFARRTPGAFAHDVLYTSADVHRMVENAALELLEIARYGVLPRNILHRVFGPAADTEWLARFWNAADACLAGPLGPIAQNFCFVARRPAVPARGDPVS